ncbi:acyltransferase [Accumulibacter sp.]|uniref:acyltransferase family protein n=1 Tax=Accumulibacter sp. TaxID=2053492 RepID=UPI00260D2CC1|nr:acyltransferase [Accumulibacter sp.]
MKPGLSLYLDLFRFAAALIVLLSHASYVPYSGAGLRWLYPYGHVAVMAFFVLSGYVIAFTVDYKHKAMDDYLIARLARLLSVVIPAMILTPLLDAIGILVAPQMYQHIPNSYPVLRVLATLLFMQESWSLSLSYFSDTPLWSVAYEFWYYMIFGVAFFYSGRRRVLGLAIIALLIGPRIFVLLPIWWLGVVAYRLHSAGTFVIGRRLARVLFVSSLALIVLLTSHPLGDDLGRLLHVMKNFPAANEFLTWSRFFLYDYLIGLLFFVHIASARYVIDERIGDHLQRAKAGIRFLAGVTFSIYLYHLPLMYFLKAVIGYDTASLANGLLASGSVIVCCFLLARFTEHKKAFLQQRLTTLSAFASKRLAG